MFFWWNVAQRSVAPPGMLSLSARLSDADIAVTGFGTANFTFSSIVVSYLPLARSKHTVTKIFYTKIAQCTPASNMPLPISVSLIALGCR